MTLKLIWGLAPPPEAKTAWGARTIFNSGGAIDLLHDRQDLQGDDTEALRDELNDGGLDLIRERVQEAWSEGQLRGDVPNRVTLVDEPNITVEANTNGSCGYLYLVAYR